MAVMTGMNSSTILISFFTTARDTGQVVTTLAPPAEDTPPPPGPPYSVEKIILFFMLVVFFVLGVVGNALAFYIYYQKRDKTTSTLFILSLAATDFVTCLISIPFTLTTEMLKYWLHFDLACKGYMFFMTFNIPLSAFIMVAVGFDRYFCICHPFLHIMTVKRAKICLLCLTFVACTFGILTALNYGVYYLMVSEDRVLNSSAVLPHHSSLSSSSSSQSLFPTTMMTTVLGGVGGSIGSGGAEGSAVVDGVSGSVYSLVNNGSRGSSHDYTGGSGAPYESTPLLRANGAGGSGLRPGGGAISNGTANDTAYPDEAYMLVNVTQAVYYGMCVRNHIIFSPAASYLYQRIYAATYLFCFLTLAILYALIYRSILIRRAWKAKRKRMSCYSSTANGSEATTAAAAEETQLTNINNGNAPADVPTGRVASRTSMALRDRMLYANVKTAAMLFVVTIFFIISFLPSWLIGLEVISMNYILFYIFFLNNVVNPFIYAFMNRTFRDDLRQLIKRIKNRLSG